MIIGRVLLVANKDGRSTFVALTVIVSKALYWHLFPTTPFEKNYFTMNFSEENLSMLVEAQVTSYSPSEAVPNMYWPELELWPEKTG